MKETEKQRTALSALNALSGKTCPGSPGGSTEDP